MRLHISLAVLLALPLIGCAHQDDGGEPAAAKWYRGNTHAHTVRCGHADSEPEVVARWYLDRGYHFLCLSEHNQFIDPATVKLPEGRREDFILVPGQEITGRHVHMTGLNVDRVVGWVDQGSKSKVIQDFTDRTRDVKGVPIINHPNFKWSLTVGDIRPTNRCYVFELHNGHPSVNNEGDATRPSTETMWDTLLTDGMTIYGVSSDDAHAFKPPFEPKKSNPGRGWVMVNADKLEPRAISDAIDAGRFYASSGVFLTTVEVTDREYRLAVDRAATEAETAKPEVMGRTVAPADAPAEPGCRIDFIGPGGKVVRTVNGYDATCPRDKVLAYLRARVTFTRKAADGTLQSYFAWTQPVFEDGREKRSAGGGDKSQAALPHDHEHGHDHPE